MAEHEQSRCRPANWFLPVVVITMLIVLPVVVFLVNNRPPNVKIRLPNMPKDNGYDYFVRAGDMIQNAHHYGPYSLTTKKPEEWTISEYHAFLAANGSALAVLREGLKKPYMHPSSLDYESLGTFFPKYASFREAARTLAGEALYYKVTNQPSKAADSLLDCIEFGVTIPRGGPLIAGLVGSAIENIGCHYFEPLIEQLPAQDLVRVAERFERIQAKRVTYADVLAGETITSIAYMVAFFSDPATRKDLANPVVWLKYDYELGLPTSKSGIKNKMACFWNNVRFAFSNKAAMVRENERFLKAFANEQKGIYTGKSNIKEPDYLFALDKESLLGIRATFCKTEAIVTLLQTEVALRRYKLDHGHYPNRLQQLVPTYLKKVPIDPFGKGKPLRYELQSNGHEYLLYSLARDMVDNGGIAISTVYSGKQGDYVAGELKFR